MFSDTYKMKLVDNVLWEVYGKVSNSLKKEQIYLLFKCDIGFKINQVCNY